MKYTSKITTKCKWCGELTITHDKCRKCEILLHKRNSEYNCEQCIAKIQHTQIGKDGRHCSECFNSNK